VRRNRNIIEAYPDLYDDLKGKVNQLFKLARKALFVARQDFLCCGNCAIHQLASEKMEGTRYVFYHHQAAEGMREFGGVYLDYGMLGGSDETTRLVGAEIHILATRAGLLVEWDGNPWHKVHLTTPEIQKLQAEWEEQDRLRQLRWKLQDLATAHARKVPYLMRAFTPAFPVDPRGISRSDMLAR
jgi:hypothetical protein